MEDIPEVEGQQTTSESTVAQSEADVLPDLRRRKRICKSQLIKAKLCLTSLLCSSVRDIDGIRSAVDSVLRYQEEVIDILNHLCDVSADFENELETVQSDRSIAEVLSKATDWLGRASIGTSNVFANLQQGAQNTQEDSSIGNSGIIMQNGNGNSSVEQQSNFRQIDRDLHRQLSKVSINKFNGNKREYQVFKDAFMECIDGSSCSKAYKMLQLRQHLTGDALKCIEGFPASELGYDSALKRLHDKFGGQRRQTLIHLDTIRMMKPVSFSDLKRFEQFVDELELCILSLQENGRTEEFEVDSMFFCVTRSKLTTSCVLQFKRWAASSKKNESLVTLHEWLAHEVRYRIESNEEIEGFSSVSNDSKTISSNNQRPPFRNDRRSKTYATNSIDSKLCVVCLKNHDQGVSNCSYFKSLPVSQRWRVAKEKRLCFRCLDNSHIGNRCTVAQQCSIGDCTRTHHFLLHGGGSGDFRNYEAPVSRPNAPSNEASEKFVRSPLESQKHTHAQINNRASLVMRVIPIVIRKYDKTICCNALLDDCSTDSYINEHIAAHLGLQGEIRDLDVCVLGGKSSCLNSTLVSAELCSLDRKVCIPFSAFTVKNVTGNLRTVDWNNQSRHWSHLRDISFPCIDDTRVDMLIGLNVPGVHRAITEIAGLPGEPVARLTPLGWTCIGPADPHNSIANNFAHFAYFVKTESDVDSLLRKSWELETAGVHSDTFNYSKSELEAVKSTEHTLSYDPIEKRYSVGVPWKPNRKLLISNYENAETRLLSLERSLSKRPEVSLQYSEIIRQHIAKGYITEVRSHSLPSWYLPHFAVVRMDKSTSKVRMVLDAAARSNGLSLNDCVNPGPKLQRELLDVLLRFRNKPIALASDISEMFLQIKLNKDDCQYHRILWRDMDPLRPVKIYQYNRLVFGNSSSPFLSQTVIREHCKRNMDEYPLAAQSILDSMYVDDLLDSVDTISEAVELRRGLTSLLSGAGFEIRKWLSNRPEVLSDIPISDRLNKLSLDDGNLPSVKTLGILWNAEKDLFTFEYTEPTFDRLTKRVVVSKTASLFDPLTLIAPFTIRAKLGIQKTWVRGIDWDDELPVDLAQQWRLWFSELSLLSSIAIHRCLIKDGSDVVHKTLHVFVDASEKAYAACCYIRCEYRDGSVSNALVVAKTRVAPLKAVSIPKIELCGAVLGVRLSVTVREVLSIPTNSLTFWCDSQNVLYWIKGESRSYKPFVSHRVGEIHELTEPIQWRYVPTKQNSADLATRGMSVIELAHCGMWWSGPEFLSAKSSEWPERVIPEPEEAAISEVRSNICETFVTDIDLGRLDPSRFSNWKRFTRVTAWVLRFISNTRKPNKRASSSTLSVEELQNSTLFWIKFAQNDIFANEIDCIRKTVPVKSNSKLLSFNPWLDAQGLLRVGGRIGNAKHIEFDAKFPIILPGNHVISYVRIMTRIITMSEFHTFCHCYAPSFG